MLEDGARERLRDVLLRAAAAGFLGPGPIEQHIDHGLSVAVAIRDLGDLGADAVLDLGAGGGVPGLVVALALAPRPVTLLDGSARRCAFLRTATGDLAGSAQLVVAEGRAEVLARDERFEGHFGVVTARSFGRPAVTAECAARFLVVGGALVVSEPPPGEVTAARWDSGGLVELGFAAASVSAEHGVRLAVLRKQAATDERYPRRVGIPEKRALW